MRLRAALLTFVVALLPACSSAKVTDLDSDQADPDAKRDTLLSLGERAKDDQEIRKDLADRAKHLAEDENVSVRLVALRVLARLARQGVDTAEIAQVLGRRARDDRDFWCRIEAIVDLCELARANDPPTLRDASRSEAEDACRRGVRAEESDRDVRIHAARELSLLAEQGTKPERALAELVQALSDETPDVRWHANRALIAIAGGDHGPSKEDWERWLKNREPETPK